MNGQRASDLLAALLPCTRGDGSNDSKRRALLSVQGQETFETFQGLILPFGADGLHLPMLLMPHAIGGRFSGISQR